MITDEKAKELIREGRAFMHMPHEDPEYKSDQYSGIQSPELFKKPVSDIIIDLPTDFSEVPINKDFLNIVNNRSSFRVYSGEEITLEELSLILWCSQGVKAMRGKNYATLRVVPCGGSRHEFELYLAVQYVKGLQRGYYHYLPKNHQLEFLKAEDDIKPFIGKSVAGQNWARKASVVFYFDMVAYRAEWRYGIYTHRVALIDAGYPSENIYLTATALGLGSCALGAIDEDTCNAAFGLNGDDEFIFLAHPVGTIREKDRQKELDFYSFIHDYDHD